MLDKDVEELTLLDPTRNEIIIEKKLNEIIDLLRVVVGGG
jgi:hypothetical protein